MSDNVRRSLGVTFQVMDTFKGNVMDRINADFSGGLVKGALSLASGIAKFTTTQDLGSVVQSFMASNGMRVMYPQLWANSAYQKNITVSFNFISPYGDPLSIFQYVYVPFFSLLAFVLPRQGC